MKKSIFPLILLLVVCFSLPLLLKVSEGMCTMDSSDNEFVSSIPIQSTPELIPVQSPLWNTYPADAYYSQVGSKFDSHTGSHDGPLSGVPEMVHPQENPGFLQSIQNWIHTWFKQFNKLENFDVSGNVSDLSSNLLTDPSSNSTSTTSTSSLSSTQSTGPMSSGPISSGSGPISADPMSSGPMSTDPLSTGPMQSLPTSQPFPDPMSLDPNSSIPVPYGPGQNYASTDIPMSYPPMPSDIQPPPVQPVPQPVPQPVSPQALPPGPAPTSVDYGAMLTLLEKEFSDLKNKQNTNQIKCIADFATNIGEELCCGQTGVLQDTRYVCPSNQPTCSNFKCGSKFGTCS